MPVVGEQVFTPWAYQQKSGRFESWEINIPPSAVFAKISLGLSYTYYENSWHHPHLVSVRKRKPDGSDEQINFPSPHGDNVLAYFSEKITNVRYGIYVKRGYVKALVVIEYWE